MLPFLVQGSYRLSSEHVSGIFLQLIGLALGNSFSKSSSSGKGEEKKDKTSSIDLFSYVAVCSLLILQPFLGFERTNVSLNGKPETERSSRLHLKTRGYFGFRL